LFFIRNLPPAQNNEQQRHHQATNDFYKHVPNQKKRFRVLFNSFGTMWSHLKRFANFAIKLLPSHAPCDVAGSDRHTGDVASLVLNHVTWKLKRDEDSSRIPAYYGFARRRTWFKKTIFPLSKKNLDVFFLRNRRKNQFLSILQFSKQYPKVAVCTALFFIKNKIR